MLDKLLSADKIILDMKATNKDEALKELLSKANLPEDKFAVVLDALKKRESIGSTGIGKGIAIPHTRSIVLDKVYLVVGRSKNGINFDALDDKPVHLFFLLCAPPQDIGTTYLVMLGKIAQIARKLTKSQEYMKIEDPERFKDYLVTLYQEK
ncbi:MAG: PTS sugar transporter subunit IIA [candidate division WOR-3 bacterium]